MMRETRHAGQELLACIRRGIVVMYVVKETSCKFYVLTLTLVKNYIRRGILSISDRLVVETVILTFLFLNVI